MTTSKFNKSFANILLTTGNVNSTAAAAGAGIVQGTAMDVSNKMGALLNVRMIRTASGSNTGQTVFRLEHAPGGTTNPPWIPLITWTSVFGNNIANAQTLNSNAAAGATAVQLSAALGSGLSSPVGVYNSATPANSEINWQQMGSTRPSLNWSLANAHSAGVGILTSYAEMWAIPIDLSAVNRIRLVVDNVWNGVTAQVNVGADITFLDSIDTA